MKSQIELLTLQREQLNQSLNRVLDEKSPILLSPPPNKRKRSTDQETSHEKDSQSTDATPMSADTPGAGIHTANGTEQESAAGTEVAGAGAGAGVSEGGLNTGHSCVREVDWEVVLRGRRRNLVQASLSFEALAVLQAESKKRRARDTGMNGCREGSSFLGRERPKAQAARIQTNSQHNTHVSEVKGNVTNGGRKIVTSSGQKVIIKFTAKTPQAGMSPRTPTSAQLKNGRNGITPRGSAGSSDTPISAHKKHRTVLALAGESKMQRGMGSPRMGPSAHTPSHTPRDKQDWGNDTPMLLCILCIEK
jgi:hypothetical protein